MVTLKNDITIYIYTAQLNEYMSACALQKWAIKHLQTKKYNNAK